VLCDRFTDSTEAYQGSGRRLGSEAVLRLHRILCGDLQPDLTILLDDDLGKSIGRARRRNHKAAKQAEGLGGRGDENRFEQQIGLFLRECMMGTRRLRGGSRGEWWWWMRAGKKARRGRRVVEAVNKRLKVSASAREKNR